MTVLDLAKKEIKKHVGAVHARGKLTLLQRKVANILLLNAYNEMPSKSRHQIRVRDLAEVAGFDSKDGALLKNSILSLMTIVIQWNALEDGEDDWEASPFLAYARVRKGVCTYGYSPELREKLYDPAIYARINLSVQRKFKSSYALALYENCIRFWGVKTTGFIDLEIWRDMLGVGKDQYKAFKELKRRVLTPAIKEVNKHSGIIVSMEPKREKRRIVALKFNMRENPQLGLGLENHPGFARYEVVHEETEEERSPLVERLAAFGLEAQASDIIARHDEARINGNLDIIEAKISRGDRIESIPAIARDAIEKDYRTKKTKIEVEVEGQHVEAKKQQEAARAAREAAERKQAEEEAARNREMDTQIEKLPEGLRARLEEMAARKYSQLMGGDAFDKYRDAKQKGEVPKMNEAVMQSFRRHVFESPEFVEPAQEGQS